MCRPNNENRIKMFSILSEIFLSELLERFGKYRQKPIKNFISFFSKDFSLEQYDQRLTMSFKSLDVLYSPL